VRIALVRIALLASSLAACAPAPQDPVARRGEADFQAAHCGACHQLRGLQGAVGEVGPPLDGLGRRTILAGVLPNTPTNLAQWIRQPQSLKPGDAMPDSPLTPQQAQDVAAFLDAR